VRLLLERHIESYEQLEVVLLLHRCRDLRWTGDKVGQALNIPSTAAETALAALRRSGIAAEVREADGSVGYLYAPASPTEAEAVDQLAEAYSTQRVEIMKLMNANALLRVRTGALRAFADAFDLGKGKKDG
jgi:predicted DNA-binding transcriptional regulator